MFVSCKAEIYDKKIMMKGYILVQHFNYLRPHYKYDCNFTHSLHHALLAHYKFCSYDLKYDQRTRSHKIMLIR